MTSEALGMIETKGLIDVYKRQGFRMALKECSRKRDRNVLFQSEKNRTDRRAQKGLPVFFAGRRQCPAACRRTE